MSRQRPAVVDRHAEQRRSRIGHRRIEIGELAIELDGEIERLLHRRRSSSGRPKMKLPMTLIPALLDSPDDVDDLALAE